MTTSIGGKCISAAQAAEIIGMGTKTFYNSYRCMHPPRPGCKHPCGIPAVRRGRSVRFREHAVWAWVERHEMTS